MVDWPAVAKPARDRWLTGPIEIATSSRRKSPPKAVDLPVRWRKELSLTPK